MLHVFPHSNFCSLGLGGGLSISCYSVPSIGVRPPAIRHEMQQLRNGQRATSASVVLLRKEVGRHKHIIRDQRKKLIDQDKKNADMAQVISELKKKNADMEKSIQGLTQHVLNMEQRLFGQSTPLAINPLPEGSSSVISVSPTSGLQDQKGYTTKKEHTCGTTTIGEDTIHSESASNIAVQEGLSPSHNSGNEHCQGKNDGTGSTSVIDKNKSNEGCSDIRDTEYLKKRPTKRRHTGQSSSQNVGKMVKRCRRK